MRIVNFAIVVLVIVVSMSSCVGKKKFLKANADKEMTQLTLNETLDQLRACQLEQAKLKRTIDTWKDKANAKDTDVASKKGQLAAKDSEIAALKDQISVLKNTNSDLLSSLSDLSIVSKAGAESIQKSMESINQQSKYIQSLTSKIQAKDSTNLVLVMNLKRSLADVNDTDINVEVKGGVVYVSISDKMLFQSGSSNLNARAEEVLGKVASVINDHSTLNVLVEGHTDNVAISNSCVKDNWDLSTKRSTAVVRVLQNRYNINPARLTAAGRSEYVPKVSNQSYEGRSVNRRTEIILTPKLDEYFKLLEVPDSGSN